MVSAKHLLAGSFTGQGLHTKSSVPDEGQPPEVSHQRISVTEGEYKGSGGP